MASLFHIDGVENAILQFSRMDTVLRSGAILQAFQIGGNAVADRAREIVRVRTGEVQGAIFARAYQRDSVPYCIVGVETQAPGYGHTIVPYAGYLEYGTKHMEAHSYLREASAEMESQLLTLIGGAIAQVIAL